MPIISGVVLSVRLLLEVITAVGLLSGIHFAQGIFLKLLFFVVGIVVILIWSRYGTVKSPTAFSGNDKLVLELLFYGIGITSFYTIFGLKAGIIYAALALIDLIMMHIFDFKIN